MINILLVEDNEEIQLVNKNMLEAQGGYAVRLAMNLAESRATLANFMPDIIILDIMLPDGSGLDFLQELKQGALANVPVLLLTALKTNKDQVRGLRAGGDDYLTKPYDYDVLLAHIEALLRRTAPRAGFVSDILSFGAMKINTVEQNVYINDKPIMLQAKQYSLLQWLARHENQTIGVAQLYEKVWGIVPVKDKRSLISAVYRLRNAISGSGYTIITERDIGYRFEKEG